MTNQELAAELHKQIIIKFEKHRVYSYFKDNIWDAELGDMWLISKCDKGIKLILRIAHDLSL